MRKAAFSGFIDLSVCEVGTAQLGTQRDRQFRTASRMANPARCCATGSAAGRGQRMQAAQCRQHSAGSNCRQQNGGSTMQAANAGSTAQSTTAQSTSTAQHEAADSARCEQRREAPRGFCDMNNSYLRFPPAEADMRAAQMIAPFSRPMTEVPNSTGERGKEATSGVFPLRCHEILEGCKSDWGTTRVLFSTSEVSADPRLDPAGGFGFLEFLLMPHQVQLT